MTKSDLKPGYVVRLRNGRVALLSPTDEDKLDSNLVLIITGSDDRLGWLGIPIGYYKEDLTFVNPDGRDNDITEVYGYQKLQHKVRYGGILLWKRREPKKMTVKEICDALGYDVEIVKEDSNA